ncbi:MAG: hypothetical protein O3A00_17510, partial [Planctomycetota bacterium]|nr:hypothetical protein [Planctomycetota bacterium]
YRLEVRAQRPTVGPWTTIDFTVGETSDPIITAPEETTAFPTIAWTAVSGAATYDLTVTDTLGNVVRSEAGLTKSGYTQRFNPGTYRATVQAKANGGGNVGSPSSAYEFTVVSNVAVTSDIVGEITDATPLFEWTEVPGAPFYELWADNRTTQTIKAAWDNRIFTEEFPQRQVFDDHQFQWQIKATGWNGLRGSWTPVKRFTVNIPSPAKPVISSPVDNSSTTDTTPMIDWNDVQYATLYDLWVNNRTTGESQIIRQSALTVSTFTPSNPLPLGEYSIEVRAANEQRIPYGNNISPWSNLVTFTIAAAAQSSRTAAAVAAMATPQITDPNGAIGIQTTISWVPVDNEPSHELWVDNQSTGQAITPPSSVVKTSHQEVLPLGAGDYRNWVRSLGNGGTASWRNSRDFVSSAVAAEPFIFASEVDEGSEYSDRRRASQTAVGTTNNQLHTMLPPAVESSSRAELDRLDAVFANFE